MVFRASCFDGQLSWWRDCFAVSLHGGQFAAISCRAPALMQTQIHPTCIQTSSLSSDSKIILNQLILPKRTLFQNSPRTSFFSSFSLLFFYSFFGWKIVSSFFPPFFYIFRSIKLDVETIFNARDYVSSQCRTMHYITTTYIHLDVPQARKSTQDFSA